MARHAAHLAREADAAVDRGDDAERHAELVEHRTLLDVDLDEAEVVGGPALELRDGARARREAGVAHRGAHRHAVGVDLVEPLGSNWPTSAPEPRKVAL
jgi:hypothetical protein